jgi:hypothetical protein
MEYDGFLILSMMAPPKMYLGDGVPGHIIFFIDARKVVRAARVHIVTIEELEGHMPDYDDCGREPKCLTRRCVHRPCLHSIQLPVA